ncbi:hypothetical protein IMG5_137680 [Ichthyophthirius multifiliis]|uniref:Uncharacterized protein n=1 Tax=Ichthyophthirius multifiliis TaxID=5932 RepID=G0QX36_ICHMU|nr:hypothetical protein IMG5_137680 [Ichthyophthirius multifiliis]EGR30213.1 hypothetical protein IMG5_137680 [Ichthyophthirius multifiliis]|eukprot:XP_004031809.1 hypothetical protein IMG5_137680 [Ichthyophthirius multifiliis]
MNWESFKNKLDYESSQLDKNHQKQQQILQGLTQECKDQDRQIQILLRQIDNLLESKNLKQDEKQLYIQQNMLKRFREIQIDHIKEHKRLQVNKIQFFFLIIKISNHQNLISKKLVYLMNL